jgi:ElaB/YqjD/DUF883 family membrane-anchored ribosome-binding protein
MTARSQIARELAALHQEMSTAKRGRCSPINDPSAGGGEEAGADAAEIATEERVAAADDGDLLDMVREFITEAEHNIAEHPAATVVGALLVGILIGRLLGRR